MRHLRATTTTQFASPLFTCQHRLSPESAACGRRLTTRPIHTTCRNLCSTMCWDLQLNLIAAFELWTAIEIHAINTTASCGKIDRTKRVQILQKTRTLNFSTWRRNAFTSEKKQRSSCRILEWKWSTNRRRWRDDTPVTATCRLPIGGMIFCVTSMESIVWYTYRVPCTVQFKATKMFSASSTMWSPF